MATLAFAFFGMSYMLSYGMYIPSSEYLLKFHNIKESIYRLDIEDFSNGESLFASLTFLNSPNLQQAFIKERELGHKYPKYKPVSVDFRRQGDIDQQFIYGTGTLAKVNHFGAEVSYDTGGRVVHVKTNSYGDHQKVLFSYDSCDRIQSIILYNVLSSGRQELGQEEYLEYDENGDICNYSFRSEFSGGWIHYRFNYLQYDSYNNWTHRLCYCDRDSEWRHRDVLYSDTWRHVVYSDDSKKNDRLCYEDELPLFTIDDMPPDND